MRANATLYLPVGDVDLSEVFPDAKPAGGLFRKKSAFSVPFKNADVVINVMPKTHVPEHLRQFTAYIESLDHSPADKDAARRAIEETETVLGLQTDLNLEGNEEEFSELISRINEHYKGCIFMFDSVIAYDGTVLIGPLKDTVI